MTKSGFTAIILAGQRPGIDPLAQQFGQTYKALVEVGGQPMLAWVGSTLAARADVKRIVIVAQKPEALLEHPATSWLRDEDKVALRDCGDSIAEAVADTVRAMPNAYPFLVTTADNVLLDDAMIDHFWVGAGDADIAVALVERQVLEAAYPGNRRTWLPFRGGQYSGANLFWLGSPKALEIVAVWRRVEQQRKKARAVLGAFGIGLSLMIGLRLLTLRDAIERVGRRFGLTAKAVLLAQAEACIDVDKPSDHAMVEEILRKRAAIDG
jgi:GTP:adenosylcobinamide-phosphate guanylyltransferase